jgi:DNA-binding NtrC family response regulator
MRPKRRSRARRHSGNDWVSLKEMADRVAAEAGRQAIRLALHATRGNKSEAARLLRTDYKTLYLKMKQYGAVQGPPSVVTRP